MLQSKSLYLGTESDLRDITFYMRVELSSTIPLKECHPLSF